MDVLKFSELLICKEKYWINCFFSQCVISITVLCSNSLFLHYTIQFPTSKQLVLTPMKQLILTPMKAQPIKVGAVSFY